MPAYRLQLFHAFSTVSARSPKTRAVGFSQRSTSWATTVHPVNTRPAPRRSALSCPSSRTRSLPPSPITFKRRSLARAASPSSARRRRVRRPSSTTCHRSSNTASAASSSSPAGTPTSCPISPPITTSPRVESPSSRSTVLAQRSRPPTFPPGILSASAPRSRTFTSWATRASHF